jgi:hypothetical protein
MYFLPDPMVFSLNAQGSGVVSFAKVILAQNLVAFLHAISLATDSTVMGITGFSRSFHWL